MQWSLTLFDYTTKYSLIFNQEEQGVPKNVRSLTIKFIHTMHIFWGDTCYVVIVSRVTRD